MISLLLPLVALVAQEPRFEVTAQLPDTPLRRFASGSFTVRVEVDVDMAKAYGWDRAPSDARPSHVRPLITLDVPSSIELLGAPARELVKPAEYAQFFLDYPYGRHMPASEVEIPFRRLRNPLPDETLGINVTAFVGSGAEARFVRRRLELPLVPGTRARTGDPRNTRWGRRQLAVGETLPLVTLPELQAEELALQDVFAEGETLLFTYRAHW